MLKVADNSKRKREDFNCIQNLVDHIADKKLEELGQEGAFVFSNGLSEIEGWSLELDEEQVILKSEKENYVTGNIMGILGMDHEQLMITSRFCKEENQDYFCNTYFKKFCICPILSPSLKVFIRKKRYLSGSHFCFLCIFKRR